MIKQRAIGGLLAFALVAGGVGPAVTSAQEPAGGDIVAQLQAQIQQLLAQVQQLQEQIRQLQGEQSALREEVQELRLEAKQLRRGTRGEEVELLQEILSTDPDIYPEKLITGYFGPLTERAVKKFQRKFGIEQVGEVGPITRSKINELLEKGAGKSGKVPPGLLIAPGIAKKLGGAPQVPEGQKLPRGIAKKLGIPGGDDDDETAPTVVTFSPADDAIDVPLDTNLIITFSETVQAGAGNLTVQQASDDSLVESMAASDASGADTDTVTFNLVSDLAAGTEFYVLMDGGMFVDLSSNAVDSLSDSTAWNFTTAE